MRLARGALSALFSGEVVREYVPEPVQSLARGAYSRCPPALVIPQNLQRTLSPSKRLECVVWAIMDAPRQSPPGARNKASAGRPPPRTRRTSRRRGSEARQISTRETRAGLSREGHRRGRI